MGTLVGHVAPGLGFLLLGLWHLFNHIKLYTLHKNSYISFTWFSTSKLKHLELFLIMAASSSSIAMELFIGPNRHQPLSSDGTIPTNHLHNFEHSSISLTFAIYALFSLVLDLLKPPAWQPLTQLLAGAAFAQQLLLFHLHSADHMGVEGQYHKLLQLIIFVSLTTTLMGIGYPKSFMVSFVRSLSIIFQGLWLIVMGFMLWTPHLISKGCFINLEEGHHVVRCNDDEALERAKSLVNIQFSWYFIGVLVFAVSFYLLLVKIYGGGVDDEYQSLYKIEEDVEEEEGNNIIDVEAQKQIIELKDSKSFIHIGKSFAPIDMER